MPRTEDAPEAMLTIDPRPFSSIPGRKARIVRCIDLTLRSNEKSQSASEQSSTLPWWTKPAQLKRTSIAPISRASAATASLERTSSLRFSASRPARPSTSMSVAMTRAPSRWKASAVARPIPAAAAVSNAVFPANRPAMKRSSRLDLEAVPQAPGSVLPSCMDIANTGQPGIDSSAVRDAPPGAALLDGAAIAQLVEHVIRNDGVGSSNLSCGTTYLIDLTFY